jgi:hypothetical protein
MMGRMHSTYILDRKGERVCGQKSHEKRPFEALTAHVINQKEAATCKAQMEGYMNRLHSEMLQGSDILLSVLLVMLRIPGSTSLVV